MTRRPPAHVPDVVYPRARLRSQTSKAVLLYGLDDSDPLRAYWIPRSQLVECPLKEAGDYASRVIVVGWFAAKAGLPGTGDDGRGGTNQDAGLLLDAKRKAQHDLCKAKGSPNFVLSGICPSCKAQVFDRVSLERAGREIITGCAFCARSFVD